MVDIKDALEIMFYVIHKIQNFAIVDVSHRPLTERLISFGIFSKLLKICIFLDRKALKPSKII